MLTCTVPSIDAGNDPVASRKLLRMLTVFVPSAGGVRGPAARRRGARPPAFCWAGGCCGPPDEAAQGDLARRAGTVLPKVTLVEFLLLS